MIRLSLLALGAALALALGGCGDDDSGAGDGGTDTDTSSNGGTDLEDLELVPCEDNYWGSETGVASQTNCRLSDDCANETRYVRLQIHAVLDEYPTVGDYPVITYGAAEPGTTRAYYVPNASDETKGETASTGAVHVDEVGLDAGVISSVTVTVDVPFDTVRVSGTYVCPIVPN
jgi:hypothetical protein